MNSRKSGCANRSLYYLWKGSFQSYNTVYQVEDFIGQFDGEQREVLEAIHHLMISYPGVSAKLRYRIPFYQKKSWICYLNPLKFHGVEFAFIRANELSNTQGLLDYRGRKQVAGIIMYSLSDIPENALQEIIHEALLIDETVRYPSKRKKR